MDEQRPAGDHHTGAGRPVNEVYGSEPGLSYFTALGKWPQSIGMSRTKLAGLLGCSLTTVSELLNNKGSQAATTAALEWATKIIRTCGGTERDVANWASFHGEVMKYTTGVIKQLPRPPQRALDGAVRLDSAFRRHWEPRSRGVERAAHSGWYFTGRGRALRELVSWLDDLPGSAVPTVTVVTGDPGSGKSAVLARLVVPTDRQYRAQIPAHVLEDAEPGTIATVGRIAAAIHAAGKTTSHVATQIGAFLGVQEVNDNNDLIDGLHERVGPAVVVLDALDEAVHPRELVRELLVPLIRDGSRTGVRMIIGTRRELLPFLRARTRLIDLDKAEYFSAKDVSDYISTYLLADSDPSVVTPYRDCPELARAIGHEAGMKAGNSFLIAQLVALDLIQRPDVIDPYVVGAFPATVSDAMDRYLASAGEAMHRRGILDAPVEACSRWVRDLLRPLAFAEGEGLQDDVVWAELATRLGVGQYSPHDVRKLRDDTPAVALLRTVESADRPVWSLFHEALAEYLRDDAIRLVGRDKDIHSSFMDVLLDHVESTPTGKRLWSRGNAYTRANLARHAAKACRLDELVTDPGFLLTTDQERTIPLLAEVTSENALAAAHVYELAAHGMPNVEAVDRATMLNLTARLYGVDWLADAVSGLERVTWDVVWTQWRSPGRHRRLPDHDSATTAVTVGAIADVAVVITASADGSVRLWELGTDEMIGDPLTGHTKPVSSVVFGHLDDCPIAITASADSSVRVWDLMTGEQVGNPLLGHVGAVNSVVFGSVRDLPVAISGGADGSVRVWDLASGVPIGEPLVGHTDAVNSVACTEFQGRPVVISGGADRTVRLWDLENGVSLGDPLEGHTGTVNAVVATTLPEEVLAISGATDGTLRLWRLGSAPTVSEVLIGHEGWVNGLAVATLGTSPVVISVSSDRTVRLWDVITRSELSAPRTGHRTKITDVAVTVLNRRLTAITTSNDRTVRLWDLTAQTTQPALLRTVHTGGINAVATDGTDLAITASNDRTVQVWDLATGQTFGAALESEGALQSAIVAQTAQGPIAVAGNRDGMIEAWDLTERASIVRIPAAHVGKVNAVELIDLDGTACVVSVGDDRALRLWHLEDGESLGEMTRIHKGAINAVATVTMDGVPVAVTGSNDRIVRTWNLRTKEGFGPELTGHGDWVRAVGIVEVNGLPFVTTGSNDRFVRVWELSTGTLRHTLEGHTGAINAIATGTVHGRTILATAATDGTLRLWNSMWRPSDDPIVVDVGSPVQSIAITAAGAIVIAGPPGVACLLPTGT